MKPSSWTSFQELGKLVVVGALAVAVAVATAVPREASASFDPPGTFSYSTATSTPQAGTLVRTGAAVVGGAMAWNASGGTAYLSLFDRTTQPSTGTAPVWTSASCAANTFCSLTAIPAGGIRFAAGVYLAFSSTGPTYTQAVGASTGFQSVAWR